MNIGFIGAGAMGGAIISALVRQNICEPSAIRACDIDKVRLAEIEREYAVKCTEDIADIVEACDIIVLSIKPQILSGVMSQLQGNLKAEQVVLSIVAGAKMGTLIKGLGHKRIIRAMPNTPAQVGKGISVWTAADAVTGKQKEHVQAILKSMGEEIYVADEKYIDMATAISGSGPAYIFLIMEALTDAAVHIGLPRDISSTLVTQTVLGSAYLAGETGKHPAELKNQVTSPGGTTAEGLLCLESGGIRAIINRAVIAAYKKAQAIEGSTGK